MYTHLFQIYEELVNPVVDKVIEGFNGNVILYGAGNTGHCFFYWCPFVEYEPVTFESPSRTSSRFSFPNTCTGKEETLLGSLLNDTVSGGLGNHMGGMMDTFGGDDEGEKGLLSTAMEVSFIVVVHCF